MGDEAEREVDRLSNPDRRPRFRKVPPEPRIADGETLEDVYEAIRNDKDWDHMRTAGVVLVPGEGASRPKIMIVGEAPGATENTAKRPFVGASGRVIRSLLEDVASLNPSDYFITNVVKYRPPGNRTPVPYEISRAIPYLRREWKALGCPPVLVSVGGTAKSALAPHLPGVLMTAGNQYPLSGGRIIWPMIHPSFVLRHGKSEKGQEWQNRVEGHWREFGDWYRREYR
jgi:uracil-DNA glycosylase family 4